MASPLDDPLSHSIDTDIVHLPGETAVNVHQWSQKWLGGAFELARIDGLSKFMLLELIAAVICIVLFVRLARGVQRHGYAKGRLNNALEAMMLFIREQVAVPSIGAHDAERFLPFLWSIFFFILVNNLLGMFPYLGSPTAALGCTGALALVTFFKIHWSGVQTLGAGGYAKAFVPHVPVALYPLMLLVEVVGHLIKPTILAVRLFVNMLAGHTVLYVILGFIAVIGWGFLYFLVTPASVVGVILLSLLELFVAFLQAYVFTFLSAIFIGAAVHPHH